MQPWFLIIPFALIAALLWWLYRRLVIAPQWGGRGIRISGALVLLALTIVTFTGVQGGPAWLPASVARGYAWVGSTWLALAWYLILGLALVSLGSLSTRLRRRTNTPEARRRVNRVGAPLAVLAALLVTGTGVAAATTPTLTPVTVTSPDLPQAQDGTTIAVITDLHAGPVRGPEFTRSIVERVNAAQPDLVVLVGDVVDGPESRFSDAIAPLQDLQAPLGVVAVTGNHEMYTGTIPQWLAYWRTLGVTVLTNSKIRIGSGADGFWLAGTHDTTGEGLYAPNYTAALDGVAATDFGVLLAHQPIAAQSLPDLGLVDLQLSGHTHGGQLWPFRPLVLLQQPVVDGLHEVEGTLVLTSRGAGTWGPPVRVGADPQIPLVTLRRG
ncbi:MAG: metallophosphoesterase [Phycicoccus sp.]|nr:metallophosphoesterase [Phycicoccus sp.]